MSGFAFSESLDRCDLCGSPDLIDRNREFNVRECRLCGYRFTSPRPSQDEIAEAYSAADYYDSWIADDVGRRQLWRKRWRLIQPFLSGSTILDVGAGMGTFLSVAQAAGWTAVGTEVSSSGIGLAEARYGLNILRGRLEDLVFDRKFDVITLWHVLEHVPSPSATVAICDELLNPGGVLVVAVPNDADERWALVRFKRSAGSYAPAVPGEEVHLSHFKPSVLKTLALSSGFRVLRLTVDDHYARPNLRSILLVFVYRIVMRITGLNLGQATLLVAQKPGSDMGSANSGALTRSAPQLHRQRALRRDRAARKIRAAYGGVTVDRD